MNTIPIPRPLQRPARLAVLISGSGTTLLNLAAKIADQSLPANITNVICSRSQVKGIDRAKALGLPVQVIERRSFDNVATFSEVLTTQLAGYQPDYIIMAGFLSLWLVPPQYQWRVLNIHPALLPGFGGKGMHGHRVHEAVIAAKQKVSGCTVHFADSQYDHGPILLQRQCPVLPNDSPETLALRVFEQECIAYPQAIKMLIEQPLQIVDGRVENAH
ncbi:MAG: phosphoribosylglycinamide formyltransferase [Phycisphaerales bacterium]|nr:phosphoribosylglycinamide formyltransferase [Phycisphaerales bacterium]